MGIEDLMTFIFQDWKHFWGTVLLLYIIEELIVGFCKAIHPPLIINNYDSNSKKKKDEAEKTD